MSRYAVLSVTLLLSLAVTETRAADEADILDAPEIDMSRAARAERSWYIRGDIGYAPWIGEGNPDLRTYQPGGAPATGASFDSARFSEPFSFGAGVGYQFGDMFRADLTAEYFRGDMTGGSGASCAGGGGTCGFSHDADYDAFAIMANGYVDLGTLAGFTPYVGAGVGATYLDWGDVAGRCRQGAGGCADENRVSGSLPGLGDWRFTYALMAGASYDLSDRVKLDLSYRFSDIAGGDMFGYDTTERALGASGAKGKDDGFQRHEFRVGLRVSLW
ncbi:MAG: porin family protein [Shinella sp.]|nr:porin family protein [Shinella sp.]